MKKIVLNIGGMTCSACSTALEKYLNKQSGIKASVNLVLAQALIEYDDNLNINDIEKYITEAGFESLGINLPKKNEKNSKKTLIIYSILAVTIMSLSMTNITNKKIEALFLFFLAILFLIYGKDIFKSGYKNIINKSFNMDTLVLIGVFASFTYSFISMILIFTGRENQELYFESSAIVIYFVKLGRFIDLKNKEKTKESIQKLVQITPTKALKKIEENTKEVTIDEVKKGDILIAKPGMRISVDGIITNGKSHLDEAFLTGESIPKLKQENDKVQAGSLNIDGVIEYRAEKIGKESNISKIVNLVVEATNTKPPIARKADEVSSVFVPIIIILAVITFLGYILLGCEFSEALTAFVTVLVVACPCALGLATPLAIVVSGGLCAKNGVLVKSSETLENAHKIDTIVFDKTGTLTYGNLKVFKMFNYSNYQDEQILNIVSSIEKNSTHPISQAFIEYDKNLNVTYFKNIPGIGISAKIDDNLIYLANNKILNELNIKNDYKNDELELQQNACSIIYVIINNNIVALIGVTDIVRENAKEVIESLKKQNKEIIMLTGDNEVTANIIASKLNINKVIANVLPQDKVKVVKDLMKTKKVMMVGDGINDAPALTVANIGVSMNSATDIASEEASVILTNNNLNKIIYLLQISKKTIKNIKQNLFWAFFYNSCTIPVAIGFFKPYIVMNPMIGSIAMTFSSLTVALNALRLKKEGKNEI